jgi:hypothetical protein
VLTAKRGSTKMKPRASDEPADEIFGFLAGKGTITGDIVSPIISPKEWGNLYPSARPQRPPR